jgi:hypothetical protein
MIYEWVRRNVQLPKVAETAVTFFESKDFVATTEMQDNVWLVSAAKRVEDEKYVVMVKIRGSPDDFFVEFYSGINERAYGMFGSLATFFGLGLLMNRRLKKAELLAKLEEQFWDYTEICFSPKERGNVPNGSTKA